MDKSAGRGNVRGKGRGREKQSQQQPQSGQQSSAPNVWNQRAQQQQPQAPAQQQQPQAPAQQQQPQAPAQQPQPHLVQSQASNPWNKGSASASAATAATAQQAQNVARGEGAGDAPGVDAVSKQLARVSIGPLREGSGDAQKRFQKPEILITRPEHVVNKRGKYGKVVSLESNYFQFNSSANWCLYQYRVDFSPEEDRTSVKRRLFNRLPEKIFVPNIFDGTVLTTIHHHQKPLEYTVPHTEDETKTSNIKIRLVGCLKNGQDYGYIQLYNLLSRRGLENLKLQLIGRNYYDPGQTIVIPEYKLEVWPGYLTSIRQHEQKTLMCAEIVGRVMRQETVLDILRECQRKNPREFQKTFMLEVVGTIVLTNYTQRTYRIDDVDFGANPSDTFEKDKKRISYAQYLKEKYQVTIRDLKQPMLVSKANQRQRRSGLPDFIYLVPEVCRTTGLTDQMRNNFHLMKEVGKYTCAEPGVRIQKLLSFSQRLHGDQRTIEQWGNWGLTLGKDLLKLEGRVMPPEDVYFGGNAVEKTSDWTRALQSMKPIVSQGKLDNWFILHPKNSRCIKDLMDLMLKASKGMKFIIGKPQLVPLENDRGIGYANMIENIMSKTTPQMIFCVVASADTNRYSTIKQKCCVDRPVPSQVVKEATIMKRNALSIMTNVVIQMNCKIGGVPWRVQLPTSEAMIIGFDVCHDTSKNGIDYGAMVASINPDCTRYYSAVSVHKKGEEICETMAEHIKAALMSYQKINGKLPQRIFMYRDGVGEGQLNEVYKVEVNKVRGMLKSVYGEARAPLTYVVVTKRINTRFFCNKQNPEPGTVVDDVVTDPDKYDFFLVSAKPTVGTITPTSYNVIHDDNRLSPEQLQRFTFKLTHLYFNTSKTVRVPAPCHYAHKLAFLVSQYIHATPSEQLSNLLYFL